MKILCACAAAVLLATGALPGPTLAAIGSHPLGVRAGITSADHYTQFHFGMHADWGEVAPAIAFVPNFEIGLGDDFTVVALNGDLLYRSAELVSRPWQMYGGGCLSFNIVDGPHSGSTTDLGMSGIAGMSHDLSNGHTMLYEIRLGIIDSPDFKFTLGYSLF